VLILKAKQTKCTQAMWKAKAMVNAMIASNNHKQNEN